MRALAVVLAALGFAGCADSEPAGRCTSEQGSWAEGETALDFAACRQCTCTASGMACEPIPGCPPQGGLPPVADAGVGGGAGQGLPDVPPPGGDDPDDPDQPAGPDDPEPSHPPPPPPPPSSCEPGSVSGLACAPDGSPIAGARVFADTTDCAGDPVRIEALATAAGAFVLEGLAPGPVTVHVEAGVFDHSYDVQVEAGRRTQVDTGNDKECIPADAAAIAVTSGDYDSIQSIVARLGFEQDVYCGDEGGNFGARALLGRWELLSRYDVVFVNCGLTVDFETPEGRTMVDNVRRFVNEGGSVYISDLAANLIVAAWPDKVRFFADRDAPFAPDHCCTCVECEARCDARVDAPRADGSCMGTSRGDLACEAWPPLIGGGFAGQRRAQVLSPALRQFLGRDTLTVDFEWDEWMQIGGVGAGVEVLVESAGEPLMVMFQQPGGGRVAYTTFHNEAQVAADVEQILRALIFQL